MVEDEAVENEDDADDLAAEVGSVADHQEPIGFSDWAADGLMTSTELLKVATELTSITFLSISQEMDLEERPPNDTFVSS